MEPRKFSRYSNRLRTGRPGFDSWQRKELFSTPRRTDWLCASASPYPVSAGGDISPELNWKGREANHRVLCPGHERWSYTTTPLYIFMESRLINSAQGQLYFFFFCVSQVPSLPRYVKAGLMSLLLGFVCICMFGWMCARWRELYAYLVFKSIPDTGLCSVNNNILKET
jgi:hypothetical protein